MHATENTAATPIVPQLSNTLGSMTVPTDTRNIGMSSDEP